MRCAAAYIREGATRRRTKTNIPYTLGRTTMMGRPPIVASSSCLLPSCCHAKHPDNMMTRTTRVARQIVLCLVVLLLVSLDVRGSVVPVTGLPDESVAAAAEVDEKQDLSQLLQPEQLDSSAEPVVSADGETHSTNSDTLHSAKVDELSLEHSEKGTKTSLSSLSSPEHRQGDVAVTADADTKKRQQQKEKQRQRKQQQRAMYLRHRREKQQRQQPQRRGGRGRPVPSLSSASAFSSNGKKISDKQQKELQKQQQLLRQQLVERFLMRGRGSRSRSRQRPASWKGKTRGHPVVLYGPQLPQQPLVPVQPLPLPPVPLPPPPPPPPVTPDSPLCSSCHDCVQGLAYAEKHSTDVGHCTFILESTVIPGWLHCGFHSHASRLCEIVYMDGYDPIHACYYAADDHFGCTKDHM